MQSIGSLLVVSSAVRALLLFAKHLLFEANVPASGPLIHLSDVAPASEFQRDVWPGDIYEPTLPPRQRRKRANCPRSNWPRRRRRH
jgi:hypothetical protein